MSWLIIIGILWFIVTIVDSQHQGNKKVERPRNRGNSRPSINPTLTEKTPTQTKLRIRSDNKLPNRVDRDRPSTSVTSDTTKTTTIRPSPTLPTLKPSPVPVKVKTVNGKRTYESTLVSTLRSYDIHSLWHMTHINNVQSITQKGIVSHRRAKPINRVDISDPEVQKWRTGNDPIFNRELHAYSPTYIAIRNPMLYRLKHNAHELCILEISLESLDYHDVLFTDGNAASRDTKFYTHPDDLKNMPWDVLKAEFWSDFADGKRKRCAEVLVYPSIGARHITNIHCNSVDTVSALEQSGVKNVLYSPQLFFG